MEVTNVLLEIAKCESWKFKNGTKNIDICDGYTWSFNNNALFYASMRNGLGPLIKVLLIDKVS